MGKFFTPETLRLMEKEIHQHAESTEQADQQILMVREKDNPIFWGESHFYDPDTGETELKVKEMFKPVLADGHKNRAVRVGRQVGKTVHMCIDILHTAYFNKNAVILVFVTEKKLMNRMVEIMGNFLRSSDLKGAFSMSGSGGKGKKKTGAIEADYDHEITVGENFSRVRFFFMNINPDKVRGQRATHIYIDEADYYPEKAWPVILGILKGNPAIKITTTSTPKGDTNTWFYNFCMQCADPENDSGVEYHLSPTMDPNWPEIEKELRQVIFDEVTWELEVMAEFREAIGSVYKKELIDAAIERSNVGGNYLTSEVVYHMLSYHSADKILGIDWNIPANGVRLVEVSDIDGCPWVTRNERISYEEYTQHRSVQRVLELWDIHKYKKIAVDAGYGEAQIEHLMMGLAERKADAKDIIHIVDANKKEKHFVVYHDFLDDSVRRRLIEMPVKQRIVELVSKYLERGMVLLKEEDEEMSGLIREIRSFQRKPGSKQNYLYSDKSHSLSALQIAMHAWDLIMGGNKGTEDIGIMLSMELDSLVKQRKKNQEFSIAGGSLMGGKGSGKRTGGLQNQTSPSPTSRSTLSRRSMIPFL